MAREICGNELNFLYHELTLNDRFLRNELLTSERFYSHFVEIKRNHIHIDNELVYRELEKMVFPIMHEESAYECEEDFKRGYVKLHGKAEYSAMIVDYGAFKAAIRKLSKVLYGDSERWQTDYEKEYGEPYTKPISSRPIIGTELDFLYRQTSLSHIVLGTLLRSKAFYSRFTQISHEGVKIDDNVAYSEIKNMAFPILHDISRYLYLRDFKEDFLQSHTMDEYEDLMLDQKIYKTALKQLSKALFGDIQYWRRDYEEFYGEPYTPPTLGGISNIPKENEDLLYLAGVCEGLGEGSLKVLMTEPDLVKAFRSSPQVVTAQEAYDIFKTVFYKWVRRGYRNNPEKQKSYYQLRKIATEFCDILYGDKGYWHKDYYDYINREV